MAGWFRDEGLVTDSDPTCRRPRTPATRTTCRRRPQPRPIGRTSSCCSTSGASSIGPARCLPTSPGWATPAVTCPSGTRGRSRRSRTRATPPSRWCRSAARRGQELRGWEVDRAASSVLRERRLRRPDFHRTGHSLGETVHGNGVNMDDYETHDDRRLLPGTGFTIEPGVYFDDFGVRSEINMIVGRARRRR